MSRTIVLVHGMFMTPLCWEEWISRFEAAGRTVVAPAWPLHDGEPATLRARHPDPELGKLGLDDVVHRVREAVDALNEAPVLIGHSMGGLVVQLLLEQGVGDAGAVIDSAPPEGVFTTAPSFVKANWPMVNPFEHTDEPHLITKEEFAYAFANTLSPEDADAAWERYVVPESRRVPRDSVGRSGRVDGRAPHPPLLLVASGADHIIPAALNEHNFHHYPTGDSVTEFFEFPGRDHLTILEPGWEAVADYTLGWLDEYAGVR